MNNLHRLLSMIHSIKEVFMLVIYIAVTRIILMCMKIPTHEHGHVFEIKRTAKKLNIHPVEYQVRYYKCFTQGRTFSNVYQYLSDHRNDKDIQKYIKKNLYAGYRLECCVVLSTWITGNCILLCSSSPQTIGTYNFCYIVYFIAILSSFLKGEDYTSAKDPANWVYDPNRKP